MRLFHLYHTHHHIQATHSDFWLYEWSVWLHRFARSLITIFVPILMLNIGYSLGDVIWYYVIYNLFDVPLNFLADWVTRKIGARGSLVIGTLFSIGFYLVLAILLPGRWDLLVLLALLAALYDVFYWVAHIYLFVESTESNDVGRSTGLLYMVVRFAGLLGPAVGAGLLIFAGQDVLIWVTIVLFFASLFPLMRLKLPDRPTKPLVPLKSFLKSSHEKNNYFTKTLYSLHEAAESVLWPLFIFVIFGTIQSVAAIPIIVSITAIIFSYFIGKIRRSNRERMIILGAALIGIIWVLRLTIDTNLFYYLSVFLIGLFHLFVSIPLDTVLFTRAKKLEPLSASTYLNTFSMVTKLVMYAILAVLVNVFQVSFILAAMGLFGVIVVNYFFIHFQKQVRHG